MQIASIMLSLRLNWPAIFIAFTEALSSANFNLELFNADCSVKGLNYYNKWLTFMVSPLIVAGFFFVVAIGYLNTCPTSLFSYILCLPL